jgi:hypothetical protein
MAGDDAKDRLRVKEGCTYLTSEVITSFSHPTEPLIQRFKSPDLPLDREKKWLASGIVRWQVLEAGGIGSAELLGSIDCVLELLSEHDDEIPHVDDPVPETSTANHIIFRIGGDVGI